MCAIDLNFHWFVDQCDNGSLLSFYWYGNEDTMLHFDHLTLEERNDMQNYISGFVDGQENPNPDLLINAVRDKFQMACEEIYD